MSSNALFQLGLWLLTALSLVGTALNVKKRIACFYLWTVVNIAWVFVDFQQELYARSVLDGVHLAFAVWGIWDWTKRPPRSPSPRGELEVPLRDHLEAGRLALGLDFAGDGRVERLLRGLALAGGPEALLLGKLDHLLGVQGLA